MLKQSSQPTVVSGFSSPAGSRATEMITLWYGYWGWLAQAALKPPSSGSAGIRLRSVVAVTVKTLCDAQLYIQDYDPRVRFTRYFQTASVNLFLAQNGALNRYSFRNSYWYP